MNDQHRQRNPFRDAWRGIWQATISQRHVRIHIAVAVVVMSAAGILSVSPVEFGLLLLAIGLVIATELVNTAIETLLDRLAPEFDTAIGLAKDIAAGAVLIAAITAVGIGLVVFGPFLLRLLR